MTKKRRLPCPCGRPSSFDACCQPMLDGLTYAPDAETLMRSRYSAFCTGTLDYLRITWHASTRPADLNLDDNPRWIGLTVVRAEPTGAETAVVEFIARYRVGGRARLLHETSRFVREGERWYYVDGDIQPE